MARLGAFACCAAAVASFTGSASASLTFLGPSPALNRSLNLVANGSFETGAPPPGVRVPWASPSSAGYSVPPSWSSSGVDGQTYASWGNDGVPGQGIVGSAPFPHGTNGLYFGNNTTSVNMPPTFHPDGQVTFPGSPTFNPTFGAPAELWQSVNTHLSPATSYRLSFWASGENAALSSGWVDGVMGLQITNVEVGDPIQYLVAPAVGSRVYDYEFVPLNPLAPVEIRFLNWGHLQAGGFASELVLDDVIINTVPAPGAGALVGLCGLAVARRRQR